MQTYELTYIISPEMTSEEAESKAKEIEGVIQKNDGVILKQSNPVARTLSYQIKKHASGFFGVLEFQLESEKLQEIQMMIKKDAKISRHLLLVKKPVKIKKQRRSKKEPASIFQTTEKKEGIPAIESKKITEPEPAIREKEEKSKVELKDIEQQLDEILGE